MLLCVVHKFTNRAIVAVSQIEKLVVTQIDHADINGVVRPNPGVIKHLKNMSKEPPPCLADGRIIAQNVSHQVLCSKKVFLPQ